GRPRELTLRVAIIVSSGYMRQNIIEDVLGRDLRHFAAHHFPDHHRDHAPHREGHSRVPSCSRAGQGGRPRPDGPGRRLPRAVLVLAWSTGTVVRKAQDDWLQRPGYIESRGRHRI